MIQRKNPNFILACLGATASILGCLAISIATVPHSQVATPRFYTQTAVRPLHQNCTAENCSSVVISK